jgi:hypothetical protein
MCFSIAQGPSVKINMGLEIVIVKERIRLIRKITGICILMGVILFLRSRLRLISISKRYLI